MPDIVFSFGLLALAIYVLVRGADWFVEGAQQVGASLGMSRFAIGVLIIGFGTSLPEFASSLAGALQGMTEIVIANVVGSNITNILLIVGALTVIGGTVHIRQDLIRSELPVFFIATTHFVFALWDGVVDQIESVLLLGTFGAYMWYLFVESRNEHTDDSTETPGEKIRMRSIVYIIGGLAALLIGAKYSVDMIETIGTALAVPVGLLSITVLAIGTSLPELFVSVRAALKREHDMAIGNIFGSNAFNALFVVGVPGVMMPLTADSLSMEFGLPILIAASLILFVSGLSRRVMRWEGIMLLMFFVFFLVKLVAFV